MIFFRLLIANEFFFPFPFLVGIVLLEDVGRLPEGFCGFTKHRGGPSLETSGQAIFHGEMRKIQVWNHCVDPSNVVPWIIVSSVSQPSNVSERTSLGGFGG